MSQVTLYTNARLIDPATGMDQLGDILIEHDKIAEIGTIKDNTGLIETVDCGGRILAPGLIDMRTHDVDSKSASAGGITTIILQPDQKTIIDSEDEVERICDRASRKSSVNVRPMGAATKGMKGTELAEMGSMLAAGAVAVSDCRASITNARVMRRMMEYATHFDGLIVNFAEDPALAEGGFAHEGATATKLGLAGIPVEAEVTMIERDALLSRMTGARVHIALVSSAAGIDAVRRAKAAGTKITCSVAPHYLHLNDNALEGYRTFAKVSPPLRGEEDRLALITGIADGTVDCIVSDHDPRSEDVKRLPLAQADAGIVGFETLLALSLSHVHAESFDLMTALKAMTTTPANLLGLKAGRLAKGAPADLVIFDLGKPWVITDTKLKSSEKNTPFDTLPVQGKVWQTIVGGAVVFNS